MWTTWIKKKKKLAEDRAQHLKFELRIYFEWFEWMDDFQVAGCWHDTQNWKKYKVLSACVQALIVQYILFWFPALIWYLK